MKTYVKKPIPVEAIQFTGMDANANSIYNWSNGQCYLRGNLLAPEDRELEISTLEGNMRAKVGDYIVRGPFNEYWPVKKEIFEATYEEVK